MKITPIAEMGPGTTQLGGWARQRAEGRAALVQAANALAPLSNSEPIDPARWAKRRDEPSPSAVVETACSAIIGEGVVALLTRIEALEARITELEGR